MLILSKYRDYYDSAHNGWIDKTVVYNRTQVRAKCPEDMFSSMSYGMSAIRGGVNDYTDNFYVIGFCGKLYPAFRIKWRHRGGTIDQSFTEIYYDIDEYMSRKQEIKKYLGYWRDYRPWRGKRVPCTEWGDEKIRTMFDTYDHKDDPALFRAHNTPIFVATREFDRESMEEDYKPYSLLVNAKLEYYEFYRVKGSVEAFQDIQSYISGVLGTPEKEPVPLSDKLKVAVHGFDPKWSFRKEPTKKR